MTIGHSTLELKLVSAGVAGERLHDAGGCAAVSGVEAVSTVWAGRLFAVLHEAGIRAVWREGLGGRREAKKDSVNTGWKNESFRGYADYMQTAAFDGEVDWLMRLADCRLDGGDVCGGCAVAMPSIADWGCGVGAWVRWWRISLSCADGTKQQKATCADRVCSGGGREGLVSGRGGAVFLV